MKKQKICVIGDGLSGLTAALALSNLDIEVDFIIKNIQEKKTSDPRITAISQSNFKFLIKYLDKNFKENQIFNSKNGSFKIFVPSWLKTKIN